MWALLRSMLNRMQRFVSFRNWGGTSAAALLLWALLEWSGYADLFSRFTLTCILVLLLIGGSALLLAGIKDLLKGVRIMASDRISPEEANARMLAGEKVVFVDARNSKAWGESGRIIPGAIRVPADAVEDHLNEVDKDSTVIAYCT